MKNEAQPTILLISLPENSATINGISRASLPLQTTYSENISYFIDKIGT